MDFRRYVHERLPSLSVPRESEILDELALHLEDLYREARSLGLDHEAALVRATQVLEQSDEIAARIRASSTTAVGRALDDVRAAVDAPVAPGRRRMPVVTDLRRDCRYAVRMLLRAPGFASVAIATLALGIGATAVIFSAIDAVLLKDPPLIDSRRVVGVYAVWDARAAATPSAENRLGSVSYPDFVDLRNSGALADLSTLSDIVLRLDTGGGGVEPIDAQIVSASYFDVLGVRPMLGRGFTREEDVVGSPVRVVVLSHRLWQDRFGGDAGIVGRSIGLNGGRYTVVGVAPQNFAGPLLGVAPAAWVPMALQQEVRPPSGGPLRRRLAGASMLGFRDVSWLTMVGRLREGQSIAEAAAALDVAGRRLAAAYPGSNRFLTATAVPLGDGPGLRQRASPVLALLGASVVFVLLIACANLAGLLLTRAVSRRREVAVRMAVGASRQQLVRQWLTEAVTLGVLGAGAGLLLVSWGTRILYGFGIPESIDLTVNPRVLAFTLIVGVGSGLVFGLMPVLHFARRDALENLRDEGGAVVTGVHATRLRSAFVVLQVALSLVLLAGAGWFIRTLQEAYAVDLGYDVNGMLLAEISPGEAYSPDAGQALYRELLDRVRVLPGVVSASAARVTVLSGASRTLGVSLDGQLMRPDRSNVIPARANVVSDGYLQTMGIPVSRGRNFESADAQSSSPVAIVSRSLAERLWPGADPLGHVLMAQDVAHHVIGVVPDTVYVRSTESEPRPFFYQALSQNYEAAVTLHIRTQGDPLALLPSVRRLVRSLDPLLPLERPRRLVDEFERSMTAARALARLAGILGGTALLMTAVGLYGVMAFMVRQRTREVGLRLALGATPVSILKLVAGRGASLVLSGSALGLAGAFVGVRFIRNQLFGVEPTDPLAWLSVSALLLLVGGIACGIPARRAMSVSPADVLRSL